MAWSMYGCATRRSRGRRHRPPVSRAGRASNPFPGRRPPAASSRTRDSCRCLVAPCLRRRAPLRRLDLRCRASPCLRRPRYSSPRRAGSRYRSGAPRRASGAEYLRSQQTRRASRCRRRANEMTRIVAALLCSWSRSGAPPHGRSRSRPRSTPPPVAAAPPVLAAPPALPPASIGPRTVPPAPPAPPEVAPTPMPPHRRQPRRPFRRLSAGASWSSTSTTLTSRP